MDPHPLRPFNAVRHSAGKLPRKARRNTKLVTPAGDVISCEAVDDPAEAQGWGYTPHWSTCNAPDSFRKGARK